jgi:hypothetical protein
VIALEGDTLDAEVDADSRSIVWLDKLVEGKAAQECTFAHIRVAHQDKFAHKRHPFGADPCFWGRAEAKAALTVICVAPVTGCIADRAAWAIAQVERAPDAVALTEH